LNVNCLDRIFNFRDSGILLDTNLLLVLLVGNVDPRLLGGKRTGGYTVDDYHKIQTVLGKFERFIIVPQVLAETAALLKQCASEVAMVQSLYLELARFIRHPKMMELHPSSEAAILNPAYLWLLYTDVSILEAAGNEFLIFTTDGGLIKAAGENALPFDWI